MCADIYQNIFKTFVNNLCNGDFIATFDKQRKDGVVTKAEFQEIMFLKETQNEFTTFSGWNGNSNNTTGYRDLVNTFWNSFDINQESGKIKGTGLYNLNGINEAEVNAIQNNLNNHTLITKCLDPIKNYANTYNYILNQLLKEFQNTNMGTLTVEKIEAAIKQIIVDNSVPLKHTMLSDITRKSLDNYMKYNIEGFYDIEQDPIIANLLTKSLKEPINIASLEDIVKYFENSNDLSEIDNYFNSKTYSTGNIYQKALMQKDIYDVIYEYINKSLPTLQNSKFAYDKTIKEEILNYINKYSANDGVDLETLIDEIKNKFFATDENGNSKGQALYDYLYTLSLYDLKEENIVQDKIKDAEGNETSTFEYHLYNLIGGKDGFGSDATKIIEWLANNDTNNPAYQNLIQEIAKDILKKGKNLTANEIHTLIYNELGVKSTDGILSQEQINKILGSKTEEPDPKPEEEVKKMPSDGFSIDNLVPTNKAGRLDWTIGNDIKTAQNKAKENLNEFLNSFYEFLKDTFNNDILQKALENVKSKYNNIIDNIVLTLNGFSGPVTKGNYYYHYCAYGNVEDNKINDYCSKDLAVTCIVDDWSGQGDNPLRVLILIDGEQLKNSIVDEYNSLLANE